MESLCKILRSEILFYTETTGMDPLQSELVGLSLHIKRVKHIINQHQ